MRKGLYFILIILPWALILSDSTDYNESTPEEDSLTAYMDTLKLPALFKKAAEWEVGSAKLSVSIARKELIKRGDASLKYVMFEKFGYASGLEDRAIEALFRANPEKAETLIYECMGDNPIAYQASSIYYLGVLKPDAGYDSLISVLTDTTEDRIKLHRGAIRAIGSYSRVETADVIETFLKDTSEYTRIVAVESLGKLKAESSLPALLDCFSDNVFTVRLATTIVLPGFGKKGLDAVKSRLLNSTDSERFELLRSVGYFTADTVKKDSFTLLKRYIRDPDSRVRAHVLNGMYRIDPEKAKKEFSKLKQMENDPFVLWVLERQ
jgi:hypothetical protein